MIQVLRLTAHDEHSCDSCGKRATRRIVAVNTKDGRETFPIDLCERDFDALSRKIDNAPAT